MKGVLELEEEQDSARNLGLKKYQGIQAVGISKV